MKYLSIAHYLGLEELQHLFMANLKRALYVYYCAKLNH